MFGLFSLKWPCITYEVEISVKQLLAEKDVHNKKFLFGSRLPTSGSAIDGGPQLLDFEVHQVYSG